MHAEIATPEPSTCPPAAPPARSRLWLPRLSLASCVRGAMIRDTRGCILSEAERFNHFPATPLCCLSWWFEGCSELLAAGAHGAAATLAAPRAANPAPVLFSGPFTGPLTSWCPGPVHGLMLLLMPDAVHALLGLEPAQFVNRFVDVDEVLPPDWRDFCTQVLRAPHDDARLALIEQFLEARWQQARPRQARAVQRYADWTQGLLLRAATSGPGRSLRQLERRVKQWAGQPMRALQGMSRAEQTFFHVRRQQGEGAVRWAEVAAEAGYADQSHLCRETRRVSGFSPEELRRGIEQDEAFWPYRVWS
jgi:AraC-like DNA-binding protein